MGILPPLHWDIVNYISGNVTVEIRGAYPERFFNLCARNGIEFWDVEDIDTGIFRLKMTLSNFRGIRRVARRSMCKIHIVKKSGLPFFLKRFKKRLPFVLGCAVFCITAWIFTSFIWVININGYDGLDTVKLLENLRAAGLYEGRYCASVNIAELRNTLLIDMPELSYVSIKFNGAHADVTVRKRVFPPDILPAETPCDIIADKEGIISDITVKTGTAAVRRGDTVTKGQLLAGGYMTGRAGTTILTHADAEIKVRTWKRHSAKMIKKYERKSYTGREKERFTLIVFGNRIKLYINSGISYVKCDKIIKRNDLAFSDELLLPLALERSVYREYVTEERVMSDDEAFYILGEQINKNLPDKSEAEIVNVDLKTSSDDKFAYATLVAECVEEIGVKREILKDD